VLKIISNLPLYSIVSPTISIYENKIKQAEQIVDDIITSRQKRFHTWWETKM